MSESERRVLKAVHTTAENYGAYAARPEELAEKTITAPESRQKSVIKRPKHAPGVALMNFALSMRLFTWKKNVVLPPGDLLLFTRGEFTCSQHT